MIDVYLRTLRMVGSTTDIYLRVYEGDLMIGLLDKKNGKWYTYEFDEEEKSDLIKFLTNNPKADQTANNR